MNFSWQCNQIKKCLWPFGRSSVGWWLCPLIRVLIAIIVFQFSLIFFPIFRPCTVFFRAFTFESSSSTVMVVVVWCSLLRAAIHFLSLDLFLERLFCVMPFSKEARKKKNYTTTFIQTIFGRYRKIAMGSIMSRQWRLFSKTSIVVLWDVLKKIHRWI